MSFLFLIIKAFFSVHPSWLGRKQVKNSKYAIMHSDFCFLLNLLRLYHNWVVCKQKQSRAEAAIHNSHH